MEDDAVMTRPRQPTAAQRARAAELLARAEEPDIQAKLATLAAHTRVRPPLLRPDDGIRPGEPDDDS